MLKTSVNQIMLNYTSISISLILIVNDTSKPKNATLPHINIKRKFHEDVNNNYKSSHHVITNTLLVYLVQNT